MTQLSNDKPDPLKPVSELVPSLPPHVSRAIERAMLINMLQRFATVQEFWQAVQGESGQQPHVSEALNSINVSPSNSEVFDKTGETSSQPPQAKQLPDRRSRKRFLHPVFLVFLTLLMIVGIGAGFWGYTVLGRNHVATPAARSTATVEHPRLSPIAHPTVAGAATFTPNPYPQLAPSYHGTIDDLQANVPSPMTLTQMRQNGGNIAGSFSALQISGTFSGFLDTSKHISFNVAASRSLAPLYFTGAIRQDGNLVGTFCEIDQDVQYIQCLSNGVFGVWNVAPGTAP